MEEQHAIIDAIALSGGRAKGVVILLTLCLAVNIAGLTSGWSQLNLLNRAASGIEISFEEADINDTIYGGVGLLQAAFFLLTAIFWFRWLHPSYRNLKLREGVTPRFTPGWAVGYWFIPFINLVRPYQIMSDLSLGSLNRAQGSGYASNPNIVGAWWGAWLLSGLIGRMFLSMTLKADEIGALISSTYAGMINDAVTILAGVLAILMVRNIASWQEKWIKSPPHEAQGAF